jgi:plastocyanin
MILRYLTPLLFIALALSIVACSDDGAIGPGSEQTQAPVTVDVEMTIEDFSFDPAVIDINLGDEIAMELANDGDEKHTFTVDEFLVDEELDSGEDADVSFTPNEPGEFTFFCRIHPDAMQGTIRVARSGEARGETPTGGGGGGLGGY